MDFLEESINCNAVALKNGFINNYNGTYEMTTSSTLDKNHQELIIEKLSKINKDNFQNIVDTYEEYEIADVGIVVFNKDMETKMEVILPTYYRLSDYGYCIKQEQVFYDVLDKYYLVGNETQKQAHILFNIFVNDEVSTFKIHFYQNDLIFVHGCEELFNSLPIEYCDELLEECINKINNKKYNTFIPSAEVDVYYENIKQKIR